MIDTPDLVSLAPNDLEKKLGAMVQKRPHLAAMILGGGTTFTKGGVTYALRGSASESRALVERSAAPFNASRGERAKDEGGADESQPGPYDMPLVTAEEVMTAMSSAKESRGSAYKPAKIAHALDGIAQAPALVAMRAMQPQTAQQQRAQNQRDDDARKPSIKTPRAIARRLGGDGPKGAA